MKPSIKRIMVGLLIFGLMSCNKHESSHFDASEKIISKLVLEKSEAIAENKRLMITQSELQTTSAKLTKLLQEKELQYNILEAEFAKLKQKTSIDISKEKQEMDAEVSRLKQEISQMKDVELGSLQKCRNLFAAGKYESALEAVVDHQSNFPHGAYIVECEKLRQEIESNPAVLTARKFEEGKLSAKQIDDLLTKKTRQEVIHFLGVPNSTRQIMIKDKGAASVDIYTPAGRKPLQILYLHEKSALPLTPKPLEFWNKFFQDCSKEYVIQFLGKPDIDSMTFGAGGGKTQKMVYYDLFVELDGAKPLRFHFFETVGA